MECDSIEALQEAMRAHDYICDRALATVVFLAMKLQKPILLEGEAGVGKTEVAKVLAAMLGAKLIRLQCYEGLDVNTALYEWNFPKQMRRMKMEETGVLSPDEKEHLIFSKAFLFKRPQLQPIPEVDRPPGLLIAESDQPEQESEPF